MANSFWALVRKSILRVQVLAVLAVFFVGAVTFVVVNLSNYPREVAESVAIDDAQIYTRALTSFRSLYTKLIVQPAQERGVEITHDLSKTGNTLLLPATMTRLIGEEMGKAGQGGESYLYSPYPFPWRAQDGGLKDQFAKDAWEFLSREPSKSFSRFEDVNGVRVLRYATADVLRQSCVNCHNAHPQSPRVGWKEGDVRGILEVRRPIGSTITKAGARAENIFLMVLSIGIFGVLGLTAMFILIRNLKSEIATRTKAEALIRDQQVMMITSSKMSALGEMAGGIAHEINTPLAVIALRVEQMEECVKEGDLEAIDFMDGLSVIRKVTDRIAKIVNGLRFFAREGRTVAPQKIKVSVLIDETLSFCKERFANHGVQLEIKKDASYDSLEVQCRAVEISQVLLNLLNNAYDAIESLKDRWATLSILDRGEYVEISVTDSGNGIPKDVQERLMQPFFTTKAIGKGTGLGLSISKGIVDSHQGKLYLDSDSKNTKFVMLLPKVQKHGSGEAA